MAGTPEEFVQEAGERLSEFARRVSAAYWKHPEKYYTRMTWNVDRREAFFTSHESDRDTLHVTAHGTTTELEFSTMINIIAGGTFGQTTWLKDLTKRRRVITVTNRAGTPELQEGPHFR